MDQNPGGYMAKDPYTQGLKNAVRYNDDGLSGSYDAGSRCNRHLY